MKATLRAITRIAIWIDRLVETFAVSSVAIMTLIVVMQVFTRKVFNYVFFWSEEITLLLLIWFSFLGIAIGFRDRLHLAMDSFMKLFPPIVDRIMDKVIALTTFGFGLYLVTYGWEFTVLMHPNRMSATEWPSSVMYIIMPITGILVCVYSLLHLLGIETKQHPELDEEVIGE